MPASAHTCTMYITDLLVDERSGVVWKPASIETVQSAEYGDDVSRPHVLGGVNTEPGDTRVDQLIHVVRYAVSDPVSDALQVSQTDQPTVANLDCVVVILCHAHHRRSLNTGI